MRIGIDASRAFVDKPTGTERYAYEVITRMVRLPEAMEHEWILYVRKNQTNDLMTMKSNVKICEIPLSYLWTQAGLAVRTWTDGLDMLWVPAHTLPLLRKPGIKTLVTIHGIEYEWLPAYENILQRWYLPWSTIYAVRVADRVIAVSEYTKKQLIVRLKGDQKKIKVIPEGYSAHSDKVREENNEDGVLKKFGLKSKQYLLFVGTVQPRKNLERLVEAFAGLKVGNLKLVIAGKLGWNYSGVLDAPRRFGVESRVVICGYVDDYTRIIMLNNALVYVQPSVTEGFGLPVLEAMAAGVPVVSSRGGALAEVVGDAGLLFNPTDIKDITQKMEQVSKKSDLREDLVKKGKKRVAEYSWDKAARETYKYLVE